MNGAWQKKVEWLNQLKVGDEVIVQGGYMRERFEARNVERITNNFIVVAGIKYRKGDGSSTGAGYHNTHLVQPSDEIRQKAERMKLVSNVKILSERISYTWLTNEELETLKSIFEKYTKKVEAS